MSKSRSIAGIVTLIFTAAAQAAGGGLPEAIAPVPSNAHPSLIVSRETRAALGNEIIDFAEQNIVNQPGLPIVSSADCGTDGKVMPSFRVQFAHPVFTADKVCADFAEANWKSSGGRYEFSNSNNNENIIFMIDLARSTSDIPKIMGVAEVGLNLPGTAKDWNGFFLFHELQHSRNHFNGTRVAETTEYDAERGARGFYRQAYQRGLVSDPVVPEAMEAVRVIHDITNPRDSDGHDIIALAGMPGMDLNDTRTPARVLQSFTQVKDAIYNGIGLPTMVEAEKKARDQPQLLYQSARKLYLRGAFDQDPVQKAYAYEFLHGAEIYGTDYFIRDAGPRRPKPEY